jgi:hypothetical protein
MANNPNDAKPDGFDRASGAPVWCAECHTGGRCWLPDRILTTPPAAPVLGCSVSEIEPGWNRRCFWQGQPDWVACGD